MKRLAVLAIVVAGAVAAFGLYIFGRNDNDHPVARTTTTGPHVYRLRAGDSIVDASTGTRCEATGEAGIPNLFCSRRDGRGRYQVVCWSDRVDLYALARHGEPMEPTFSVPAKLSNR